MARKRHVAALELQRAYIVRNACLVPARYWFEWKGVGSLRYEILVSISKFMYILKKKKNTIENGLHLNMTESWEINLLLGQGYSKKFFWKNFS